MKRKLLLMGALFAGASLNAQIFSESFDTSIPATWTIIDVDGLPSSSGQSAYASFAWNSNNETATSSSWYDNNGTGPTNDWLITPAIILPASGNLFLNWIGTSNEATFLEEYEVLISTTGTTVADFTSAAVETVVNEPFALTSHSVALAASLYGQTIYVAFHHTSSDESMLHLDDIEVIDLVSDDIELVSVNNANYAFGSTVITGTVQNNGSNTITSFDIDWNDGTAHNATINGVSIPYGTTYDFSHTSTLTAVGGTTHSLTVTAMVANDAVAANNTKNKDINGVTSLVDRVTVGEEKTGTWCGWCPRGAVALEAMEATPNFIGIAVHNGDPMTVTSYDSNIGTYVPGGYPGGGVDRVETGDPSDFSTMHAVREQVIAPGTIEDIDVQIVGSNLVIEVSADFVANMNGDQRIAVVVTEDNVTGTSSGYNQVNYYSGGSALTGAGHNWTNSPNPVLAADMEYDHVARALGDNEILGAAGSLPVSISAGDTETHIYTVPIGASWELTNVHVVAMLVDAGNGEILNAGKAGIEFPIEVALTDFDLPSVLPFGSSDIIGTVENLGTTAITTLDVSWNDGNGANNFGFTGLNIAPGTSYDFTHPIQISVIPGTAYSITLTATTAGDYSSTNNSITKLTSVPSDLGLVDDTKSFGLSIYPNPATESAQLKVDLDEVSEVDVTIYNTSGALVYSNLSKNLPQGSYFLNVDVSEFAKGLYLVNTTVNGKTNTTKLSVQ